MSWADDMDRALGMSEYKDGRGDYYLAEGKREEREWWPCDACGGAGGFTFDPGPIIVGRWTCPLERNHDWRTEEECWACAIKRSVEEASS